MTNVLLSALNPVFFTLALGWFAGARGILDNRQTVSINLLLMNFALPASLFVAMARTPRSLLRTDAALVLVLAGVMLAVYAGTFWMQRRLFGRPARQSAVQALTVAFPNCAAIGLSLLPSVFGGQAASIAAIGIAVGAIVISPLTIAILEREQASRSPGVQRRSTAFLAAFQRPVVLAPILGVLLAISGVGLPDLAARSLLLLGQGAAGIALFLTGMILSAQPFRFSQSVGWGVLLKNFLQPLAMFAILRILGISGETGSAMVLLTAVPAGFFGTVFGARFQVDTPEASATLVASTLLSAVTLAGTIFLLRLHHGF